MNSNFNHDYVSAFKSWAEAQGFVFKDGGPIGDGHKHRCSTKDKPGKDNGEYRLHLDFPPNGYATDFREGSYLQWKPDNLPTLTPEQKNSQAERIKKDQKAHKAQLRKKQKQAAGKAREILSKAAPATNDNPYLKRKGVCQVQGLMQEGNKLLVPVKDKDGKIQSLQEIYPDGGKKFFPGGKMQAGYFPIPGDKEGPRAICEGLATGLSIHMATGWFVLCAFNANNLMLIAQMVHRKYPNKEIILCGDNDHKTEGNPGKAKARAAAQAVGGKPIIVSFTEEQCAAEAPPTDFNDLHQLAGIEEVKRQLLQGKAVTPMTGPFVVEPDGVYHVSLDDKGNENREKVCSWLRVVACTRNEIGGEWGRLLEFKDSDGKIKRWSMPMSLLAGRGDAYREHLYENGLIIEAGIRTRNLLQSYLIQTPDTKVRCVSRTGWHGGQYIFPSETVGPGSEEIVFQTDSPDNDPFQVSGTLDEWKQEVAVPCRGNSRFVFCICAAFAGPLLKQADMESGGFNIYGESSGGKTTGLELAGTVWGGGGLNGFKQQWRTTDNGLEGTAVGHSDSILVLDEIGQADPKVVGKASYMLANGQGKKRATKKGHVSKPKEWRVLFLSSGENTLKEYLLGAGIAMNAGQEIRVPDIPADAGAGMKAIEALNGFGEPAALVDHFKQACMKYYGTAARSFLEALTNDIEGYTVQVKSELATCTDHFLSHLPSNIDSQVKRVCGRFSLVAVAGELAISFGVLPWPAGEAKAAALKCFKAWVGQRGGVQSHELKAGIEAIVTFIQAHGSSRFIDLDEEDNETKRPVRDCVGTKRHTYERGIEYRFYTAMFVKEVAKGKNLNPALKYLRDKGVLLCEKNTTKLTKKVTESGKSQRRYVFTGEILSFSMKAEALPDSPSQQGEYEI